MKLILCVEDELDILENNRKALVDSGYKVITAANLEQAREWLDKETPDAIVLDIMLPDGIGLDLLAELREDGSKILVILLTAWDKPSDVSRGLRLGANDYLSKPFDYEELIARIEAMFRNAQQMPDEIKNNQITLKIRTTEIVFGQQKIKLPPVEFFMLQLFLENEGKILKAEYIYEKVWGADMNDDPTAIKNTITRLRKKIVGSGYEINTIRTEGYRFEREG